MDFNAISGSYAFQPSQPHLLNVWLFHAWSALVRLRMCAQVEAHRWRKIHAHTSDAYAYRVPYDRTSETRTRTHEHPTVKRCVDNQQWVGTRVGSVNRTFRVCIESARGFPVKWKWIVWSCQWHVRSSSQCVLFFSVSTDFRVSKCVCVCTFWQIDFESHTKTARITWMKNVAEYGWGDARK